MGINATRRDGDPTCVLGLLVGAGDEAMAATPTPSDSVDSQVSDSSSESKTQRVDPQRRASCRIVSELFSTSACSTMSTTKRSIKSAINQVLVCRRPATLRHYITSGTDFSSEHPIVGALARILSHCSCRSTSRVTSVSCQFFSLPSNWFSFSINCWI